MFLKGSVFSAQLFWRNCNMLKVQIIFKFDQEETFGAGTRARAYAKALSLSLSLTFELFDPYVLFYLPRVILELLVDSRYDSRNKVKNCRCKCFKWFFSNDFLVQFIRMMFLLLKGSQKQD